MALKLMYITNKPDIAIIAEQAGVDRIFIDMEYIGKADRQGGMNTVQNHHTVEDVKKIKKVLKKAKLLVRVNPIHEVTNDYISSKEEIDEVINAGSDIIMLPYFKTLHEVQKFVNYIAGRAKVSLLLETPEAVDIIDDIIMLPGIDEIHIGMNDLSLGYKKTFMFELLADGTIEKLCYKFKNANIPYGFGGIAAIGTGTLPAEMILKEHYRLGSNMVILSRSFCDTNINTNMDYIRERFENGVKVIRAFENEIKPHKDYFYNNTKLLTQYVNNIVESVKQNN